MNDVKRVVKFVGLVMVDGELFKRQAQRDCYGAACKKRVLAAQGIWLAALAR